MYLDSRVDSSPLRRRLRRLSSSERTEEARAFIKLFYRENGLSDGLCASRLREITRSIRKCGYYEHTSDELAFGARIAWRNHARCIGRLHWKSLDVFDCRHAESSHEIAGHVVEHMRHVCRSGSIRSAISIFPPVIGTSIPSYIENSQILQYAGYISANGAIIGDPLNVEFTRIAITLGWRPPDQPSPFDLLPLIIRNRSGNRDLFELPNDCKRDIAIVHPTYPRFTELQLRWYTIPVVSDMILTIGGIDYPCAPFNGHYMATEIASRDFADENRYNILEKARDSLELNADDPLWRDTALTELNRAVLHSFQANGATICDHHTATDQFLEFHQLEKAAQRPVSADWNWIVPPQASAACPTFHLAMRDLQDVPNFYRSRSLDGAELHACYEAEHLTKWQRRRRRLVRRLRRWMRQNIK